MKDKFDEQMSRMDDAMGTLEKTTKGLMEEALKGFDMGVAFMSSEVADFYYLLNQTVLAKEMLTMHFVGQQPVSENIVNEARNLSLELWKVWEKVLHFKRTADEQAVGIRRKMSTLGETNIREACQDFLTPMQEIINLIEGARQKHGLTLKRIEEQVQLNFNFTLQPRKDW